MGILNFFKNINVNHSSGYIENCFSTFEIPDKKIIKSFGMVYYTEKHLSGNMPQKTDDIFSGLLSAAKNIGANAVINTKITTGSYQAQGSKFIVTYVIAYGDAVILAN
ncbi:hypothetical protein BN1013_00622 [Candidatus Rubidus massiliensis]|nr:hypothetical protein BN1013_00622 [Candidatus Rubidus massiliensis]